MDNPGDHRAKQNSEDTQRKMSHFCVESRFKVRKLDVKREGGAGVRKASSGNSLRREGRNKGREHGQRA